jgi:hypothetical protein
MNIEEQNRDYVSEGLWVTIATDTILRWKIRSKTEYALLELLERIEKDYKELFYPLSQEDYNIYTIEPNYLSYI